MKTGQLLRSAVRAAVAVPLAPVVIAAALVARPAAARRRRRGLPPRLIWGPVPILSIKYWSAAMRARGYESRTLVTHHYDINERGDFDLHYDDFLPPGIAFEAFRPYAVFLWVLRHCDVYLSYFDGGFLSITALRRIELPLLRLAGKMIVATPYGSDIAVCGHLGVAEEPLLRDYPETQARSRRVRRRVDQFSRWATLVVRNYQYGYLPRWDVLWPTLIAIDTDQWRREQPPGTGGEVVVVHAPNHRHIKGSDQLIEVVERLKRDGVGVRLELIERRPNSEVREAVLRADIVAEQFIAGYALFAIEGMAAGLPVLSALGWMAPDVRADLDRRGLPIVDADIFTLQQRLRELIEDPPRRLKLGEEGRRFVLAHHSYEAVGAGWEAVIRHVWSGDPLPAEWPVHSATPRTRL